jgi:hypothetical protein
MWFVKYEILLLPDLPMPSLTWFGKGMALLVFVQTMANLCPLSVQDICMLTVTLWRTMQSTSSTLSTGMFTQFMKLRHELNRIILV